MRILIFIKAVLCGQAMREEDGNERFLTHVSGESCLTGCLSAATCSSHRDRSGYIFVRLQTCSCEDGSGGPCPYTSSEMRRILQHIHLCFHFQTFFPSAHLCAIPFAEYLHVPDSHTNSVCHRACQVCFLECLPPPSPSSPRADINATYELFHICPWMRSAPDAACNGTLPPS